MLNHSNMIAEENLTLNSLLYLTTKQKLHTLLYVKYRAYKLHPVDLQVWHDQQQRQKQEWYIRVCVQIPLRKESFLYLKIFFLFWAFSYYFWKAVAMNSAIQLTVVWHNEKYPQVLLLKAHMTNWKFALYKVFFILKMELFKSFLLLLVFLFVCFCFTSCHSI